MKRAKTSSDVIVDLGESRSYPIVFAPIKELSAALADNGFKAGKCILVSNDLVGKTVHKDMAMESLESGGWNVTYVEFPDGEVNKTSKRHLNRIRQLILTTKPIFSRDVFEIGE